MKRLKSIDSIRGACILTMVYVHMIEWWLLPGDINIYYIYYAIFADITAAGFLTIAGISAMISHRKKFVMSEVSEDFNSQMVKKEYFFRALLILIVALIYNCVTAIFFYDISNIWKWFIPLTIAVSLLMGYPFLKTSKVFRLIFALIFWIFNYILVSFLFDFKGQLNFYGVSYFILYNII